MCGARVVPIVLPFFALLDDVVQTHLIPHLNNKSIESVKKILFCCALQQAFCQLNFVDRMHGKKQMSHWKQSRTMPMALCGLGAGRIVTVSPIIYYPFMFVATAFLVHVKKF